MSVRRGTVIVSGLGSVGPQDANYYNLGTTTKSGYSISASTVYADHLALSGPIIVKYAIYSTDVARTLDPSYLTMFIYSHVQTTSQTLSNGSFSGQVMFIKNNTQSSINLVGSFGPGLCQSWESTFLFIWDGTAWN